jgi:hypothetical protein
LSLIAVVEGMSGILGFLRDNIERCWGEDALDEEVFYLEASYVL